MLYAIRIVDSGITVYYLLPPPFCVVPWSRVVQKTQRRAAVSRAARRLPMRKKTRVVIDSRSNSVGCSLVPLKMRTTVFDKKWARKLLLFAAFFVSLKLSKGSEF